MESQENDVNLLLKKELNTNFISLNPKLKNEIKLDDITPNTLNIILN